MSCHTLWCQLVYSSLFICFLQSHFPIVAFYTNSASVTLVMFVFLDGFPLFGSTIKQHCLQRFATIERPLSNTRYAIRNGHRFQRFATLERPMSNTCYAIRNIHGSQRFAILERIPSNTRKG